MFFSLRCRDAGCYDVEHQRTWGLSVDQQQWWFESEKNMDSSAKQLGFVLIYLTKQN